MKFFMTPLQKKILEKYWREQTPFTLYTLWEEGAVKNEKWGAFSMKRMVKKGQIIGFVDTDGKAKYIGITDSKREWEHIKATRRRPMSDISSSEDTMAGLNRYEREETAAWMREIIENKKKEIMLRKNEPKGK